MNESVIYERGQMRSEARQFRNNVADNTVCFAVSERVEAYYRRAEQYEAAAARVSDPEVRSVYVAMGARWRKMAEQQQDIEDFLAERGGSPD